ncbi:MAG: anhydro-N-acetylmuramic acid kinase [Candidatus Eisenbacteria bacterium]|uniref:Anhydro-N-acetylmuramic acid kinase n=1 Tax=Eiseniibacteriota bacterium TaxID=2212470 RepID=A0A7Y2H151_UNCEI|nr:anhydro-N-acetylmuramic acid kinase [Candidatus Eisenbacteria bacterium]
MKQLMRVIQARRRRIIGVMSGTSADGVDVVLMDIETLPSNPEAPLSWELIDFLAVPYGESVRAEILAVQEGAPHLIERVTRLHFLLPNLFADAIEDLCRSAGIELSSVDLIASHGQTLCHFPTIPENETHRGASLAGSEAWGKPAANPGTWLSPATLQVGDPAVLAERTGVSVISNFRSRDVAAGGTGAPLVPMVDYLLFGNQEKNRIALNIGGIANLTALRKSGSQEDVIAFDTGPGNMILDALMELSTDGEKKMDAGGALARRGTPDSELVEGFLEDAYFSLAPPKSAGREQFGFAYAEEFWRQAELKKLSSAALLSSAVQLTTRSIHEAVHKFVPFSIEEVVVSGGGAHNVAILEQLAELFKGCQVVTTDYYGLDVDAKEATAFAILGHLSLDGTAGNLPSVTGARRSVVLGDLTPGGNS